MKFRLYREYGALNSGPIFNAVELGLRSLGHDIVSSGEDIPVIWSVLWHGRMKSNKLIFDRARNANQPVMIIEVGNLFRNSTWRISLNHVNRLGIFGNDENLDLDRPKKLGINLKPINNSRGSAILIAGQHQHSLQWQGQPDPMVWINSTILEIRRYSDRPVIFRPHPRSPIVGNLPNVKIETPSKVQGSYDDFNIKYNFHCVINFNAGPAVKSAIEGTPVICDPSSLAYPVSDKIENIEKINLPDRSQWFIELCHTEWTVNEIAAGIPFQRLDKYF